MPEDPPQACKRNEEEERLLRQYVEQGSETAFHALVTRYLAFVYTVCRREVQNPDLAQDVTQAVFLVLARKARTLHSAAALSSWLFQTARLAARNALRVERRRIHREREVIRELTEQQRTLAAEAAAWSRIQPHLNEVLAGLRPSERTVILLRFFQGLSLKEVAEALGLTDAAVKMRLARTLEKMRRRLAEGNLSLVVLDQVLTHYALPDPTLPAPLLSAVAQGDQAGSLLAALLTARARDYMEGTLRAMSWMKLQSAAFVLLSVVGLVVGIGLVAPRAMPHLAPPGQKSADTVSQIRVTLADDPRLLQRVSLSSEGIPVGELVNLLAQKTGVPLEADSSLAEEKVIVFSPVRPLRETLTDLAALFNGRWLPFPSRSGAQGYRIGLSRQAQEGEQALEKQSVKKMQEFLERQVRALELKPEQLAKRPASDPIRQRLSDPNGRIATLFYSYLTPAHRDSLFAGQKMSASYEALDAQQKALADKPFAELRAQQQQFHDAFLEELAASRPVTTEEAAKVDASISPPDDLQRYGLTFLLEQQRGERELKLQLGQGAFLTVARFDGPGQWPLPPHGDPYTRKPIPGDVSLPEAAAVQAAIQQTQKDWGESLHRLAERTGVPVMADTYRVRPLARPGEATSAAALDSVGALDAFCRKSGYLWWPNGKTLLFRKRDWYLQRQYETLEHLLRTLVAHLKAQRNAPSLADLFSVSELSPRQLAGLNAMTAFSTSSYRIEEDKAADLRELLALLALPAFDKNKPLVIFNGGVVDFRSMTLPFGPLPAQQSQRVLTFVTSHDPKPASLDPATFNVQIHANDSDAAPLDEEKYELDSGCVQVYFYWNIGNVISTVHQYHLRLPTVLQDDGRERIRIEIAR